MFTGPLGRRTFLLGASAFTLAGCVSTQQPVRTMAPVAEIEPDPVVPLMYAAMPNEQFPIPEVDVSKVDQKWWRTEVEYPTGEKVGTVVVDTPNRYLYHVRSNGQATRYGVGVGRDGFAWAGQGHIAYKREWPRWRPPNEMVARIYRIHGTPEFSTIGKSVSSGCIRMLNQDVIHLADNIRDGSAIVVIPDPSMSHLLVG
ncbi:MAG: hypothetical protein B7Y61_07560 [Rhizobiales bacterium 35-66-30]|nr:MAG: hypothetical protein B7Y61_07560 [Rhizobiales bacterium 35-66-30]